MDILGLHIIKIMFRDELDNGTTTANISTKDGKAMLWSFIIWNKYNHSPSVTPKVWRGKEAYAVTKNNLYVWVLEIDYDHDVITRRIISLSFRSIHNSVTESV